MVRPGQSQRAVIIPDARPDPAGWPCTDGRATTCASGSLAFAGIARHSTQPMNSAARLLHLYISTGHNFVGRHGLAALSHPMLSKERVECRAGRGVLGDRFLDRGEAARGHITFFAVEVHAGLMAAFGLDLEPSVYRRNVVTEGIDPGDLIGKEFQLQQVRFLGVEECRPCHWMSQVCAPGVEEYLRGRGGLRARILSDGVLRVGLARLDFPHPPSS